MDRRILLAALVSVAAAACAPPASPPRAAEASAGLPEVLTATPRGIAYEPKTEEPLPPGTSVRRVLELPAGADRSTLGLSSVPVGTRAWQEISVNGRLVETRLVERTGEDPRSWSMASWVWNREGTSATLAPLAGVRDVNGTGHDVPAAGACISCHARSRRYLLGVRLDDRGDQSLATSGLEPR